MLIPIIAATDRDKNLLRGGNEQLSCCHCLIQPPRSFRFLPANHAEKLKAQRRVLLNAGDPQEQWWLSQVTNVHRPFDPIVSARVQSDAVCVITALKGGLCVVRPGRPSKIEWWRVMNCVSAPLVCSFWSRFKQFFSSPPSGIIFSLCLTAHHSYQHKHAANTHYVNLFVYVKTGQCNPYMRKKKLKLLKLRHLRVVEKI